MHILNNAIGIGVFASCALGAAANLCRHLANSTKHNVVWLILPIGPIMWKHDVIQNTGYTLSSEEYIDVIDASRRRHGFDDDIFRTTTTKISVFRLIEKSPAKAPYRRKFVSILHGGAVAEEYAVSSKTLVVIEVCW